MKQISDFQHRLKEAVGEKAVNDIAQLLEISKQSASAYLLGTRKPKRLALNEIARRLNVNPAWLMGYDVEKELTFINLPLSSNEQTFNQLTPHEEAVIAAYRKKPSEAQKIIDAALGVGLKLYIKDEIKKIEDSGIIEAMTRQKPTKS